MTQRAAIGVITVVLALVAPSAFAEVVELQASKDNTLYEDITGALSNGSGDHFFAGRTAFTDVVRRGLIAFDIAGNVPAGATIDSVSLTLNMSMTIAGAENVDLHRVLNDWGEGTSDAGGEEGGGDAAERGDATWVHTFFPGMTWDSVGGDFDPVVSASLPVGGQGQYTWSSAQLVADVQDMLDDQGNNFGWILIGNESVQVTAKRFDTKDNPEPEARPVLVVEYTSAPEVPSITGLGRVVLLALIAMLGLVAMFRMQRSAWVR